MTKKTKNNIAKRQKHSSLLKVEISLAVQGYFQSFLSGDLGTRVYTEDKLFFQDPLVDLH